MTIEGVCPRCAAQLPTGARFCPQCGTPVAAPTTADRRMVTVLFADIADSTSLSTRLDPERVREVLAAFYNAANDELQSMRGRAEKFVGDAVMAVWGYTASDRKALDAFRCAEEMIRVAAGMEFGGHSVRIGVGLNIGKVFSGNVGNEGKKQFTVLGMPVNLAARFESKAKVLGAPVVMGRAFRDALPPELQRLLTAHPEQVIQGDGPQTLYTFDPARDEKGQSQ